MLTNSSILITGGTGSFGHTFVPMMLTKYNPYRLVIYSRDEMKQWEMAQLYGDDPRVRFFIGDVWDKDRLSRALNGIDYVVHAAWFRKRPAAELMRHSDRGSQYASHAFQRELEKYGMICSMSRKGNCWGNSPTENRFNSLKNERIHGLRYETRAEMTAMSFEYIEVLYNRKRQHSSLGYKSPIRFLDNRLIAQQKEKLVA